MALPTNFCVAPFIQLQTSRNNCGPCPYNPDLWEIKGNINEKWRSKELINLRNSFLEGKKDPQCNRCWKEEEAGKRSLRLRLLNVKGSTNVEKVFEKYIASKKYENFPRVLTLIPGNECNLACATCSGVFSSKWNSLNSNNDYSPYQRTVKNWNLSEEQYHDIVDNSHHLQKIELFGGEPFLNKKNKLNLIQKIVEKGTAKNIVLYFNTNGTMYDQNYLDYLTDNFKFVEIRQSIDGLHEEFEYLRYGAKFDAVIENAEKFASLSNSNFEVICTVSIFNVITLPEFDQFMSQKKWSVYYNMVSTRDYLYPHNLPDETKDKILFLDKFKDIKQYTYLQPCISEHWQKFVNYTKLLDKNRKTSFKNAFPALFNLVKKHGYE